MPKVISCGVIILSSRHELFLCHATGTPRWDLPKGLPERDESPVRTAVRETWEETSLILQPERLHELGVRDYLPAKALHLFALRVAADAFDIDTCRCLSTFPHRFTGEPTPEVDAYAWVPLSCASDRCGKNLTPVLQALDWAAVEALPLVTMIKVEQAQGQRSSVDRTV